MKHSLIKTIYGLLQETLPAGLLIAITVYLLRWLLFYEIIFPFVEEARFIIITTGTGCLLTTMVILLLRGIQRLQLQIPAYALQKGIATRMLFVMLLMTALSACNIRTVKGIKKDTGTGLTASYSNLVPGNIRLIMNGEVLGHTQIPLGEEFMIINENIEGLTVKNNTVAVGCSLLITDKKGNLILSEPDLFANNGIYNKDSVQYLKCTVSTGKPMEWQEEYIVTATFHDKYGNGSIENKVTISIEDIP